MSKTSERIKLARVRSGLSVGQASRFIEYAITKDRIKDIESGAEPTENELEIFSDLYRANIDWLTGGLGNKDIALPGGITSYMDADDIAKVIELLRMVKND